MHVSISLEEYIFGELFLFNFCTTVSSIVHNALVLIEPKESSSVSSSAVRVSLGVSCLE